MSVKATVQNASNKLFYGVAGKHVAGQHSLAMGEIAAIGIAVFALGKVIGFKDMFKNKWVLIALIAIIAAFCIW
jgi:hypothetical protein